MGQAAGGVHKSTTGGTGWSWRQGLERRQHGPSGGRQRLLVRALVMKPGNPGTLYAGTNGSGVFRTVDGGTSWEAVNVGLTSLRVFALAVDPARPTMLVAGTREGVFRRDEAAGELGRC